MTVSLVNSPGVTSPSREILLTQTIEGVMAGIISADQFTDVFTAAKGDNVIQATITAVYELGTFPFCLLF